MSRTPAGRTGWALVVPVKRLDVAKTRLARLAGPRRADLAVAFALDTVAAALSCPSVVAVLAVTDEQAVGEQLHALGAHVVPDVPDAGLNPAVAYGVEEVSRLAFGARVGALSSDLPALRPAELDRALRAADEHRAAFVCDAKGIGTTVLLARSPDDFHPRFGRRSRAAHRAAGAHEIDLPGIASVRCDVDTEVDLVEAYRLGPGPRSAALVADLLQR